MLEPSAFSKSAEDTYKKILTSTAATPESEKLEVFLYAKKYSVKDTGLSYRQINELGKAGLIPDERSEGEGWRAFSFADLVYLALVRELKGYGLSKYQMKYLHQCFYQEPSNFFVRLMYDKSLSEKSIVLAAFSKIQMFFSIALERTMLGGRIPVLHEANRALEKAGRERKALVDSNHPYEDMALSPYVEQIIFMDAESLPSQLRGSRSILFVDLSALVKECLARTVLKGSEPSEQVEATAYNDLLDSIGADAWLSEPEKDALSWTRDGESDLVTIKLVKGKVANIYSEKRSESMSEDELISLISEKNPLGIEIEKDRSGKLTHVKTTRKKKY